MPDTVIVIELGKLGIHDDESIGRKLKEAVEDIAAYAASSGQRHAPRQTGNLVRNITSTRATRGAGGFDYEATAGVRRTAPYGPYVESGTGIFGPSGSPIRARPGNFLVFEIGGRTIFTKSVKGQPAQRFMRRAYIETNDAFVRPRLEKLQRDVGNL